MSSAPRNNKAQKYLETAANTTLIFVSNRQPFVEVNETRTGTLPMVTGVLKAPYQVHFSS